MGVLQKVAEHLHRVGPEAIEGAERLKRLGGMPGGHVLHQGDRLAPVGQAQHVADGFGADHGPGFGLHDRLVQHRKPVPHRAFGRARDQGQAVGLDLGPFVGGDLLQPPRDHLRLDPPEVEALAARQDGHRHLADLGGGEDELGVRRRLFQGLQERVERRGREHVHFVDDVDLVAGLHRGVAHAVQQFAHLIDLGARGGVQLQHVDVPALDDRTAMPPLDGEVDGRLMHLVGLEVQRPGQQSGGGGLAHAADAGEHEGVGDAARREGVAQGAHHRLLADHVLEALGPVFAGQHHIAAVGRRLGRGGGGGGGREHLGRVLVTLGEIGFERVGVRHHSLVSGNRVETGRRPEAKLVTAASFRT